jgi:hypothetical protein
MKKLLIQGAMAAALFSISLSASAQTLVAYLGADATTGVSVQSSATTTIKGNSETNAQAGLEVKVIAQEEKDSKATTTAATQTVEARGGIMAFLFGTDYKSLGVLRAELAKTENRIERLEAKASATTDATLKAELNAEIAALTASASTTNAFIVKNESKFSLFGWFVKLFV